MSDATLLTPTAEVPTEQRATPPALRVLIVDDEATTVMFLRRALESAGYEVVGQTTNGSDGVETARDTQPDFILMDYSMPGIDGVEATKQIMADRPVPIIMLTGHNDEEHVGRAIEAGASTYLVKPITSGLLLPAIQTALDVFAMSRL